VSADTPAGRDRAGKRALFTAVEPGARQASVRGEGRQALFSGPAPKRGTVVVECSACETRSTVGLLGLVRWLVPTLWIPFRTFPHLMQCPHCRRLAWCRLELHGRD
jgi:hypothetical protein